MLILAVLMLIACSSCYIGVDREGHGDRCCFFWGYDGGGHGDRGRGGHGDRDQGGQREHEGHH
jgi:hypothetical protein